MDTHYFLEKALRSLSVDELKRFEKFLNSPLPGRKHCYYNAARELFIYLKPRYFPHYRIINREIDFDCILGKIWPIKMTRMKHFKSEMKTEFLHYILYFLKLESITKSPVESDLFLLKELESRNLKDIFDHYCKPRRFRILENYDEKDAAYYYFRLFQIMNTHREKYNSIEIGDYEIEHMLLIEYLKREEQRIKVDNSMKIIKPVELYNDKS